MKKRTYIVLAVCLLVVIGAVCTFFYMKKRNTDVGGDAGSDSGTGSAGDTVLSFGSRGEDVKELQRYLNNCLLTSPLLVKPMLNGEVIDHLNADGIFGERTECVCKWKFGKTSINISEIR